MSFAFDTPTIQEIPEQMKAMFDCSNLWFLLCPDEGHFKPLQLHFHCFCSTNFLISKPPIKMLTVYNKYYLHITLVSLLPACQTAKYSSIR